MKIKAKENGYLTQVGEVTDNERVYCTEVLTADADEWRDASEEEYEEWMTKIEELSKGNYGIDIGYENIV